MAQIDPNTVQWDAPPQPVGKPVTGAKDQPLQGGVILPGKPEKPEKPTETFRLATEAEKKAAGLDPNRAYQISNITGEFKDVGGQPTAKPAAVDPNRIMKINSALDALANIRQLAEKSLSVGETAGRVRETPLIGAVLGQNRADLEGALSLVEGNLIQDQLAVLAQINPGGIASLANAESEARRLASSIANLDPNQSQGQFLTGVQRAEEYYKRQLDQLGAKRESSIKVDAQGREIVTPELRVAEGAEFSTEQDFKRQRDSAEAWAATQGLPFDQALAQFNSTMQAKGYGPAGKETIDVLQWWEKNKPADRGAVQWALPKTGVRESQAPGRIAALGSGLLTGGTAGMAEEVTSLFDPAAAAKLEASKRYARENYAGTELLGEAIGGFISPFSRIGPGGTIGGEATRGAIYGGLMGAGEPTLGADITERLKQGVIGAGLGGAIGGAAQRVLGGRLPPGVEIPPASSAPEIPAGAMAPEAGPAATVAPEAPPMAATVPTGMAEEVVVEAATMTPQEIGDLARKAVGRGPGSAKAKSQLATIAKSNPEAVAAADRLGLELPVDVLSDNAQLRSLTGLARSEVGSEAETAWGETARSVIQRANQAMDELGATPDLTQVSADVFKRVDDAQQALGKQAGLLREEVEATFNTTDRVEPTRIREWLQGRINELGGGKEGLAALSAEEKKLWGAVSKGKPTYARLNEARDMIGQALNKGTGPWADANLSRVKQLYGALADDQINFIESTAGKEIADKQRAANTLFQEMYKGREQMQDIFGKDLSKSLVPLMQRAITSGAKGDISALNQLVSSVPEDMRGTVLTSALFNAAKTRSGARGADEMFSFTNFSNIYRDLRSNKEVYKQIAKAIGPEGDRLLTDLYAISRRMADAESKVLKTGKANQALDNSLNAERLLNRVLKGAGARLGAATVGGVAAGPVGVAVAGGLTEGAQYIAQGMGKKNADKVHALLSSEQFRNLIDNVGSSGNIDQAINRVAGSRPFIDYLKSIGVEAKQGKNWLRSALTVAPISGVTRQGESEQPVVPTPMIAQQ